MLYVVATPIGNLGDITLRALETLRKVSVIACEDTRETLKLLRHYDLGKKELIGYHNFNERQASEKILARLEQGEEIALVSDAGTPALSDPGFYLVRAAFERGIKVVPIVGASALTAAISVCPLPVNRFYFEGFLPHKKGRQSRLRFLASQSLEAIIFYESPHRLLRLLEELQTYFGDARAMVARELTKLHEEIVVGTLSELKATFSSKKILGELVVVLSPIKPSEHSHDSSTNEEDEHSYTDY
ncbi:MAG: 16S rRNA (cytidine(1402)-2'-O)-methyltransferase [Chloroherpetonaceae bacterium]|nr:16S rRNA (cytidine(1402)-2'-O)-methyltransferase [Chloroherpetonaceae bacterium]MCS7211244.1 16S rRNA (cytidine(1402)-2'-O)-methyltransferase [Chloroherpetonaceae bacterium]MDW8020959.1 16S rRNA (cytidine(1402)-2'-O)-methyltransferase [Chloroherpetonaceae bacterium]MDW8467586.1 16S rRNA (cytidine(1402)-2'-O)-methyltransferase [Chloroherpetonaceae bacterium]